MSSDFRNPNRTKRFFVMRKCKIRKGSHDGWTDATWISYKTQEEAEAEARRITKVTYNTHRVYNLDVPLVQFVPSGTEIMRTEVDPRHEVYGEKANERHNIRRTESTQRLGAGCRRFPNSCT